MNTRGHRSLRSPQRDPAPITPAEEAERQHAARYSSWVNGLTPEERFRLEERGLLEAPALTPRRRPTRGDDEEGDNDFCGAEAIDYNDPCAALMAKEEEEEETARDAQRADLSALCYVLPVIVHAANPRLETECIALAIGTGARQGLDADAIAHRHGLTKMQTSAQVRAWQVKLGTARLSTQLLSYVLPFIMARDNPRLEADIIAAAASLSLRQGESWRKLSEKYGITVADFSARVNAWVEKLPRLMTPASCKKNTANYRLFNVRQARIDPFKNNKRA